MMITSKLLAHVQFWSKTLLIYSCWDANVIFEKTMKNFRFFGPKKNIHIF